MDKSTSRKQIVESVERYYSRKALEFGATPQGVDWNSAESQELRMDQLIKIVDPKLESFSILDVGCGYGHFYHVLTRGRQPFCYHGFDLSPEMISLARESLSDRRNVYLYSDASNLAPVDYAVASGIFNVKLENDADLWEQYIFETIDFLSTFGTKGFSFNMLTTFSDKDRMVEKLYYGDPCKYFIHCKQKYSRNVALLHDYNLFEFTILVRK